MLVSQMKGTLGVVVLRCIASASQIRRQWWLEGGQEWDRNNFVSLPMPEAAGLLLASTLHALHKAALIGA